MGQLGSQSILHPCGIDQKFEDVLSTVVLNRDFEARHPASLRVI